MKAIHDTDGATARNGTSQTAYQGKMLGLKSTRPPMSGTARAESGESRRVRLVSASQSAAATMVSAGASSTERTMPGLKYSSAT